MVPCSGAGIWTRAGLKPGPKTELLAAARCAEMAAKYRKWANDLSVLIDDHIEPHA